MYNGVKYSKWILRKAYEDVIPKDIIWRPKAPLEAGTGTETLRTYFNDMITDKEFADKKAAIKAADDVEIQDKEQLLYYEDFRKKFGKPQRRFPQSCRRRRMSKMPQPHQNQNTVLQNLRSLPHLIFFYFFVKTKTQKLFST